MLRWISVVRTGTKAASFKLKNDEVARVSGYSDKIASTWSKASESDMWYIRNVNECTGWNDCVIDRGTKVLVRYSTGLTVG